MKYRSIEVRKYITLEFEEKDLREIGDSLNALGTDKTSSLIDLRVIIDAALEELRD